MKHYWLCGDVRGFRECDTCTRNPEHASNEKDTDLKKHQPRAMPLAGPDGCADARPEK